jgi:hypothetical protein
MQIDKNSKVGKFLGHVMPGVIRPLRVLWNEIIGFVFIVLAFWTVPSTVRYIRQWNGDGESFFRVALSLSFAGLMAYFGVTSFLRARKISRS